MEAVRNGDLVFFKGTRLFSYITRCVDGGYSHVGMIYVARHGEIYVMESINGTSIKGSFSGVQLTPLKYICQHLRYTSIEIYRLENPINIREYIQCKNAFLDVYGYPFSSKILQIWFCRTNETCCYSCNSLVSHLLQACGRVNRIKRISELKNMVLPTHIWECVKTVPSSCYIFSCSSQKQLSAHELSQKKRKVAKLMQN